MAPAREAPQVRDATDDDLDAVVDVRARSFGPLPDGARPRWQEAQQLAIALRRALTVTIDGAVAGYARIHAYRQLWGGRALPMAGIGGVVVAPEHRGRGVGSALMRAVLDRSVELGDSLSVLYPATVPVYRALGWEWGGGQHRVSVDATLLRGLRGGDAAVRRAGPADADVLLATVAAVHVRERASGPLVHAAVETRTLLADPSVFAYVTDGGALRYGWRGDDLLVQELTAGSASAARALWAVVGSGSSVAPTVHAYLSPADPLHLLLPEKVRTDVYEDRWMLRVLDLPAAVRERGFPPGADLEVPLVVDDPLAPGCAGRWLLRVADGRGDVARTDDDRGLRVGANGLAALFAGTPVQTLRTAGLGSGGDPAGDARLDVVFAARPYLLDYF